MFEQPVNVLDVSNRQQFRSWLDTHHATESECWVVVRRGRPMCDELFYYLDAVEEALCFGWIDSIQKEIDGVRPSASHRGSPRVPGRSSTRNAHADWRPLAS